MGLNLTCGWLVIFLYQEIQHDIKQILVKGLSAENHPAMEDSKSHSHIIGGLPCGTHKHPR